MRRETAKFLKHVRAEAKKAGIRVSLINKKIMKIDGVKVNGYFDDIEERVLKCAINKPEADWFPILVHEYCHLEQYVEQCSVWKTYAQEETDVVFEWLNGQRFYTRTVKRNVRRCRNLELDCEKRVVKNIKKFNLDIDIPLYCKRANSYIFFYNYAFLRRTWYKKAPYLIPSVYNKFRKDFKANYNDLPERYIKLYDKFCV